MPPLFIKVCVRLVTVLASLSLVLGLQGCQKTVKPQASEQPKELVQPVLDPAQLVLFEQAVEALDNGRFGDAEKLLVRLEQKPGKFSGVQTNLGAIALRRGDAAIAKLYLEQATQLNPNNKHAWLLTGELAMLNHDYDAANDAYKKALVIDDTELTAHFNLGVINDLYLMDYSEAEIHYERYLELATDSKDTNTKQVKIWLKLLERK
jgi:tetratricopeptide (TPR) repeat protein